MNNPIYQQFGNQPNNMNNIMQRFQQFQRMFRGNPQQMIQQMMNSGQITQEQFNNAVKQANQMMKMFK